MIAVHVKAHVQCMKVVQEHFGKTGFYSRKKIHLPESLEISGLKKYQTAGSLGEFLTLLHSVQTVQVCQKEICVEMGLIFIKVIYYHLKTALQFTRVIFILVKFNLF